ncbi:uncharacterized protein J8A68_001613 [[Candida] subhashii]|uniref:Uncharacterized protein n=1 Tax=[Candida] subhashii TaxID=561895 RepID=A0A8J5R2B0_9ASCO|nr:uncharacterized protein J8A68_001613 [[Candida] subhashii]KAG7664855.1 hypothetical protein J8A68_001613 [[Candida] subhashii]
MSSSNGFESINLASTTQLAQASLPPLRRLQSVANSTTSDEEEEDIKHDIDPVLFISTDKTNNVDDVDELLIPKPLNLRNSRHRKGNNLGVAKTSLDARSIDTLRGSEFESVYEDSIVFPRDFAVRNTNIQANDTSPIEYVSDKIKHQLQDLNRNSKFHAAFLKQGDDRLHALRNSILNDYDQVSRNYYSLNELYSKDADYTERLYGAFKKWDQKRDKVLNKIKDIKSPKSKHGSKMMDLLNKSIGIDQEIEELEQKLQTLKTRKQVVTKEIEDTSSVLESKTAKYINIFRNMEETGKEEMLSFLISNGVPSAEVERIIKTVPVDVTFLNNITPTTLDHSSVVNPASLAIVSDPENVSAPTNVPSTTIFPQENGSKATQQIGIQPYVLPDESNTANKPKDDLWLKNHEHGPTPYEKGYAKGTQNSMAMKAKLQKVMKKVLESTLPEPQTKTNNNRSVLPRKTRVDDLYNTISQKLDLVPIVKFLEHKMEALTDLTLETSKNAALFHDIGKCWNNACILLDSQEEKLHNALIESTPQANNEVVFGILTGSLKELNQILDSTTKLATKNNEEQVRHKKLLQSMISNEVQAIIEGLRLVSQGNQLNEILNDYENVGKESVNSMEKSSNSGRNSFSSPIMPSTSKPTSQIHMVSAVDQGSMKQTKLE